MTSFCTSPYTEDEELLADIVLAQVDQRVLFRELGERAVERRLAV
jgi:hypothetical protein